MALEGKSTEHSGKRLIVLCFSMGAAMSAYFAGATLVPLYAVAAEMSPALIGFLVALTYLAPLALGIPIGRSIDSRGAKPHMVVGIALLAMLPVAVVALPSVATLAALQVAFGLGQILLMLSGQSLAASIGTENDRNRNFGWYTMAVSGGQLVGPLLAGFTADALGLQHTFAVCTLMAIVGLIFALLVSNSGTALDGGFGSAGVMREIHQLWKKPTVRFAMVGSSTVLLVLAVNQGFLPLVLSEHSASTVAMMFSLQGLAALATRPFLNRLSRAFHSQETLLTAVVVLVALGMVLISVSGTLWPVVVAMILVGIGSGVSQPLSMVMVLGVVERSRRGIALGFRISANRLAQLGGPLIMGVVATAGSVGLSYALMAVMAPVAIATVRGRGGREDPLA